MHAAQLALNGNMEAATAIAISDAAITGVVATTDANIATPATAYPATAIPERPTRSPNLRLMKSVTAPPLISPTTLSSSGKPEKKLSDSF